MKKKALKRIHFQIIPQYAFIVPYLELKLRLNCSLVSVVTEMTIWILGNGSSLSIKIRNS
jgi:hypothetical protein